MFTESEGIILRQTEISGGRRMILIFSKRFGKISAGTNINERGRGRQALAIRPFTYGNYQLFKRNDYFNINGAQTIKSFYSVGEDVDKYMSASFALELVDKVTQDMEPMPGLFNVTVDYLTELEKREKKYETLLSAYLIKVVKQLGIMPELTKCTRCGKENKPAYFSIKDGGMVCEDCGNDTLIYELDFGIIDVLNYLLVHPLESLSKLALEDDKAKYIIKILTKHAGYHIGFDELKSEAFITV